MTRIQLHVVLMDTFGKESNAVADVLQRKALHILAINSGQYTIIKVY